MRSKKLIVGVSGAVRSWHWGVGVVSVGSALTAACGSADPGPASANASSTSNNSTGGSSSASTVGGSSSKGSSSTGATGGTSTSTDNGVSSGSSSSAIDNGSDGGTDSTVAPGNVPDSGGDSTLPPTDAGTAGGDSAIPQTGFAVVTNRYDNFRTGANTSETTLNVANVRGGKFGLLFSRPVDGHVYAEPLYLPNLPIAGGTHNVVFVETEQDSVYAFDADNAAATAPLWKVSLGTPMTDTPGAGTGSTLTGTETVTCRDMYPHSGITSTPAIDRATGRMYIVAKTVDMTNTPPNTAPPASAYHQYLHALDVLTGRDVAGSPVEIKGSVPGTGDGSVGGVVTFSAYHHLNRPGLLLTGGNVFIGFASHCDDKPYHGWVFAYSADTLTQKGIYATTPNGIQGGIWQSGMGLVGDQNDVYFVAGNGTSGPADGGVEMGLGTGHLQLSAQGLKLADYWTAYNAGPLNTSDSDLTSAPVLLPNPKVLVAGGKDSNLYVMDPMNMGGYNATSNKILQQMPLGGGHIHGGPVYWNGPSGPTLFVWPESATMRSFTIDAATRHINPTPLSTHAESPPPKHPGGILTLSSNGTVAGTAVLWVTFTSTAFGSASGHAGDAWHYVVPGVFYAFDATNLATPIWTSTANAARDDIGLFAKFNPPTVANGRVYVASQGAVSQMAGVNSPTPATGSDAGRLLVYGLMP